MDSKSIWLSKSFWAAVVTFAISILGLLVGQEWIAANPSAVATIGMVVSVLNVVLRTLTDKGVVLFKGKDDA